MAQKVPGTPPQASYPGMPQPGLVRQIVATPWLTLVLIGSSLFVLTMMAFTVWGDRGLLAMWRMQHDLDRLLRDQVAGDTVEPLLSKDLPQRSNSEERAAKVTIPPAPDSPTLITALLHP